MTFKHAKALTLENVIDFLKGVAVMIASAGIILSAYVAIGLPVPVSQEVMDEKFKSLRTQIAEADSRIENLEVFARATRSIILRGDRRDIQVEIQRYREMMRRGTSTPQTIRLIQTLEKDVDVLESQIRKLED